MYIARLKVLKGSKQNNWSKTLLEVNNGFAILM